MDAVFGTAGGDSVTNRLKSSDLAAVNYRFRFMKAGSWHKSPSWSPKGAIRRVVDRVVAIFRVSMPLAPGHQLPMGESHSNMIREAKTRTCQASKYLEREP